MSPLALIQRRRAPNPLERAHSPTINLGPYGTRIHNVCVLTNFPQHAYAAAYMVRLSYYAYLACTRFNIHLHELSEFFFDSFSPNGTPINRSVGYTFPDPFDRGPVIRLVLRVSPITAPGVFLAEDQTLFTLSHEIAHVLMQRKFCNWAYGDHGNTFTRETLRVWEFLKPLMMRNSVGWERFGTAYLRGMTPWDEFRKLPRRFWGTHMMEMWELEEWLMCRSRETESGFVVMRAAEWDAIAKSCGGCRVHYTLNCYCQDEEEGKEKEKMGVERWKGIVVEKLGKLRKKQCVAKVMFGSRIWFT
ncbi:hypothetical protein EX30DRAFT_172923 [Ascodesmis nigricans]|uniref:SprT-like domain-containing protein n=1 Tax=Ascodesmis nigricans TaxID=341454 RepID=A0A4S2MLI8_9PEZI|nr:hypothetical protein EX30DRAFT_172923 [Ascodesmis nigricans]